MLKKLLYFQSSLFFLISSTTVFAEPPVTTESQQQVVITTIPSVFELPEGMWLPVYKDFKDWTVACDNLGSCTARNTASSINPYEDIGAWITIEQARWFKRQLNTLNRYRYKVPNLILC